MSSSILTFLDPLSAALFIPPSAALVNRGVRPLMRGIPIVDRWFGVKAEVFSIGIRPELFGFTDAARLTAIPIGG